MTYRSKFILNLCIVRISHFLVHLVLLEASVLVVLHETHDLLRSNVGWASFQDELDSAASIDDDDGRLFCQNLDVVSKTLVVLCIGLNNLVFT